MIIPLEEFARLVAIVDAMNRTDPKLLRYSFNDNLMSNESSLSNFDYGRELIKFIGTPPEGKPS